MAKRPKMPTRVRRFVYQRDGYVCRHCGWSPGPPPADYDGKHPLGVVVGTKRKLVYFKPSLTDKPDVRRYEDVPIVRFLEIDHVIPLAAGGAFKDPTNLQSLCSPCNGKKGATV